ncbi:ankyrin repeat domain-containing protein 50-like [Haliotis rufescens]|uniref:ankyrin repeat domain-containing protein 50-like n=1 Tax=Haliotis rufescens TaxID=6454 RepID=UPI00201EA554|nr:ankyrin repeat domain-containing protein 50-like [Haliotis rufescens]
MAGERKKRDDDLTDQQRLFLALREGRIKKTRIILEASDETLDSARNEDGHTLLIAACQITDPSRRLYMTEMLMDREPEVNRRDLKGRTALSHACEVGCCDVINVLIRHHSVDPDAVDFKGDTPLIHGARHGQHEAIKLLTQTFRRLGLKVDHFNDEGFSALLAAARNGHLECCQVLVSHGKASLNLRDKERNLLPIDWLQQQQFDHASIEFLRPKTKFYRVAKLATSLAKAKSMSVFDKKLLPPPTRPTRSLVPITRTASIEKKSQSVPGHRIKPQRQKAIDDGPSLLGRRGSQLTADAVYNCTPFTSLLLAKSPIKEEAPDLPKKTLNRQSSDTRPKAKPRKRRANKTHRRVSIETPLNAEKDGVTGVKHLSVHTAPNLKDSCESLASVVTSTESISLSDDEKPEQRARPREMF